LLIKLVVTVAVEAAPVRTLRILSEEDPMETRTVDTHIRRLREKLGSHAQRVETVRGEGYRFNPVLDP
jgi:DNA-binding response OmpR family regulator